MALAEAGAQPSAGLVPEALVAAAVPVDSVGNLPPTFAGLYPLPCDAASREAAIAGRGSVLSALPMSTPILRPSVGWAKGVAELPVAACATMALADKPIRTETHLPWRDAQVTELATNVAVRSGVEWPCGVPNRPAVVKTMVVAQTKADRRAVVPAKRSTEPRCARVDAVAATPSEPQLTAASMG